MLATPAALPGNIGSELGQLRSEAATAGDSALTANDAKSGLGRWRPEADAGGRGDPAVGQNATKMRQGRQLPEARGEVEDPSHMTVTPDLDEPQLRERRRR